MASSLLKESDWTGTGTGVALPIISTFAAQSSGLKKSDWIGTVSVAAPTITTFPAPTLSSNDSSKIQAIWAKSKVKTV